MVCSLNPMEKDGVGLGLGAIVFACLVVFGFPTASLFSQGPIPLRLFCLGAWVLFGGASVWVVWRRCWCTEPQKHPHQLHIHLDFLYIIALSF